MVLVSQVSFKVTLVFLTIALSILGIACEVDSPAAELSTSEADMK